MKWRLPPAVVEFGKVWGLLAVIVVAGFVATYQYVDEPPPRTLRIATGGEDGAYHAFAQRYARLMAADGVDLEVEQTAGSAENLELLREGRVSLAMVQGGTATEEDREALRALGSLFLEPLWVLTPEGKPIARLQDLRGRRIAVGLPGSGTAVLATQVLAASGVDAGNATLLPVQTSGAGDLLANGEADAVFLVASPSARFIQEELPRPHVELFDFERAAAFSRVFPFLKPVELSEGVLNLEYDVPRRDTTVVAVAAMLVARRDLNPALIPTIMDAVTRVHRAGGILETPREFPSVDLTDVPMNDDAARYITEGPSFLYRWLPYGTAVRLDRLKLFVLPFIALLLPLFRVAPPLYQWRIRSRIYRWYAAVREIDLLVSETTTSAEAEAARTRLRAVEREVAAVSVPLAYTGELYHLRLHIRLLEEKLQQRSQPSTGESQGAAGSSHVS